MSEHSPGEERRHFTRIPIDSAALLRCADQTWESKLLDISLKGALLERPDGYAGKPGEQCTLEMQLEQPQGVSITMEGSVAHVAAGHIGFRCEHISLDSISHLKRLVELNLGDETALERELSELAGAEQSDGLQV